MTKLFMNVLFMATVVGLAACSSTGTTSSSEETLTQAPYAEERTVGNAPAEAVQSAEPVFESKQVK